MLVKEVSITDEQKHSIQKSQGPWHFLYFLPLPQGHFSFRPILPDAFIFIRFDSWHFTQVQATGCSLCQLVRDVTIFVLST